MSRYIIDHYEHLAEATIFACSANSLEVLLRIAAVGLDASNIARRGFVSLECRELETYDSLDSPFADTFPDLPKSSVHSGSRALPTDLALTDLPCCARFALSADKIRATPRLVYEERRAKLVAMDGWSQS